MDGPSLHCQRASRFIAPWSRHCGILPKQLSGITSETRVSAGGTSQAGVRRAFRFMKLLEILVWLLIRAAAITHPDEHAEQGVTVEVC